MFMLIAMANPAEASNMTVAIIMFFRDNLPGIIVGDIAAAVVAAITGQR
jgi:hypothetical protein